MNKELENNDKIKAIDELIRCYNARCVELLEKWGKSSLSLSVYLSALDLSAVSTEMLENCYNVLYPYFQVNYSQKNIFLELSSAGLERKIKDVYEFVIFQGCPVRVYDASRGEWLSGIIDSSDNNSVCLRTDDGLVVIAFENINKANLLDSSDFEAKSGENNG